MYNTSFTHTHTHTHRLSYITIRRVLLSEYHAPSPLSSPSISLINLSPYIYLLHLSTSSISY